MNIKQVNLISVQDWDKLVSDTYGKPYDLQQQDGCQDRGIIELTIPESDYVDEMHDDIPEEINGEIMGVKFEKWLARDPKQPVAGKTDYTVGLWWDRNFYPDIQMVANDLFQKGVIPAGDYIIEIDW